MQQELFELFHIPWIHSNKKLHQRAWGLYFSECCTNSKFTVRPLWDVVF